MLFRSRAAGGQQDAQGKRTGAEIYVIEGCADCHGAEGGGDAGPALAQHASQQQGAAIQIDWLGLVRQQQQLADKLAALCRHYLTQHGVHQLPTDSESVLNRFRQPPQQQAHYALTLATLLALALELGEPARTLFDSLLPQTGT